MTKFERLMDELGEKYDDLEENEENDKQFILDLKAILDECERIVNKIYKNQISAYIIKYDV